MAFNPFYGFKEHGAEPPIQAIKVKGLAEGEHGRSRDDYDQALAALLKNMYEVSGDPSGSVPELYLSPDDAEICKRITKFAKEKIVWKHANELGTMLVPRKPDRYSAWENPLHTAKAGLTKALFFTHKGDEHRGYVFGRLGASPEQLVALCEDGKLRSLRSHELEKSKGIGWGALPNSEILRAALGIGKTYGVEYMNVSTNPKSKTLVEKLLENVPKNEWTNEELDPYGLTQHGLKREEDEEPTRVLY